MINATAATSLSAPVPSYWSTIPLKNFIQKLLDPALNGIQITNPQQAHFICSIIPANCPFERDVVVFGQTILHIPALCKLNPAYDQLVALRFRALTFLADECGEDVTPYCQ